MRRRFLVAAGVVAAVAISSNSWVSAYGRIIFAAFFEWDQNQAVTDILRVIREEGNSPGIQEWGWSSFKHVASGADGQNLYLTAIQGGAIGLLADCLQKHSALPKLQYQACGMLAELGMVSSEKKKGPGKDVITPVIAALDRHPENLWVQMHCCSALAVCARWAYGTASAIRTSGGVEMVVKMMQGYKENAEVQHTGCITLAALASHNDNRISEAVREAGGIELLVAAMTNHTNDVNVQTQGTVALAALAVESTENVVAMREAGGVEAVIHALKSHRLQYATRMAACLAIHTMASTGATGGRITQNLDESLYDKLCPKGKPRHEPQDDSLEAMM